MALLLLAADSATVVPTSPFRDLATAQSIISSALFSEPTDIDTWCGEMTLQIELTVPSGGFAQDVQIDGPRCAQGRIEVLRKAILRAPRNVFIPAKRSARYRFKMKFERPLHAE